MTTEPADPALSEVDPDRPVLMYLAALETGRSAADTLPHPGTAAGSLAHADMVGGDEADELETDLAESAPGSEANVRKLEERFVKAAPAYAARHGMTYEAWRRAGVEPEVLARAGIQPAHE